MIFQVPSTTSFHTHDISSTIHYKLLHVDIPLLNIIYQEKYGPSLPSIDSLLYFTVTSARHTHVVSSLTFDSFPFSFFSLYADLRDIIQPAKIHL
jgi:hypothetical protein